MVPTIEEAFESLLHDYYDAESYCIWEASGTIDEDIKKLRADVDWRSRAFLGKPFDFTDND